MRMLLAAGGVRAEAVEELAIAGGFGSHLNPGSAVRIGLISAELAPHVRVLGNASLAGAAAFLLDRAQCARAEALASRAQTVHLGGDPAFDETFVDCLLFDEEA